MRRIVDIEWIIEDVLRYGAYICNSLEVYDSFAIPENVQYVACGEVLTYEDVNVLGELVVV